MAQGGSGGSGGSGAQGGSSAGTGGGGGLAGQGGASASAPVRTDVEFPTTDSLTLRGHLTTAPEAPTGSPGVLLLHQFQSDDEQWAMLPEDLAVAGYRTLAFNLRGHGDSDPYSGALSNLLNDPDGAPSDVDAALRYLAADGGADASRIAIVGTSIGANLAVASSIGAKAKTYVAFSARLPPTEALAGAPAVGMQSVFYLAAELDSGNQAADAQTLFDATSDPRRIEIFAGISDHGIALLSKQSTARALVFDWLDQAL